MNREGAGRVLFTLGGIGISVGIYRTCSKKQEAQKKSTHMPYGLYEAVLKRPLDVLLSVVGILLLSPIIFMTAVAVRIKLGSPVLFAQERPGLGGKLFTLYKFRTMTDEKGSDGKFLSDDERLTDFGRLLRSTSLDELPELFNILRGEMSLVGPRPLLVEYLKRYSPRQSRRHEVRPGLTGYAQVMGRNSLSWEERLERDVDYVEHITFLGDLKILFGTVKIVLKREGISSKTSPTMEIFIGNQGK